MTDKLIFKLIPRGILLISVGAYLMTPLLPMEIGVIMASALDDLESQPLFFHYGGLLINIGNF